MTNAIRETVAGSVRAEMARARCTQKKLARKLGYKTQQSISRRLCGDVPFTVDELAAIAAELGCDITLFFTAGSNP